jgi:ABC-type Fe3+/spermidine/putrescine transport system ATPase subunit
MIRIRGVCARYESFRLEDIDLDVAEGEHFVLLGPSGAGKTLLTETVLGLRRHSRGEVTVAGQPVRGEPIDSVPVSYVPQDLAVFPHLSVRDNITFGARARRMDGQRAGRKLEELSELLNIGYILDRRSPSTLSIGEKQRVALARALFIEPRVLFLDEPFSSLDYYIKRQLIEKLREIRDTLSVTVFQVTHDHEEAFMLADRLAVMFEGRIAQVGTPSGLQRRPATLEVARFLLAQNIFEGEVVEADPGSGRVKTRVGELLLTSTSVDGLACGEKVSVVIRPEEVHVIRPDRPLGPKVQENLFAAEIYRRIPTAAGYILVTHIEGLSGPVEIHLSSCAFDDLGLEGRSTVPVSLKAESLWFIPR